MLKDMFDVIGGYLGQAKGHDGHHQEQGVEGGQATQEVGEGIPARVAIRCSSSAGVDGTGEDNDGHGVANEAKGANSCQENAFAKKGDEAIDVFLTAFFVNCGSIVGHDLEH